MSRLVGRIKWFAESEGYGFIEFTGSSDIFLHHTALEDDFRIESGGLVEFEIIQGPKGPMAEKVTRPGDYPVASVIRNIDDTGFEREVLLSAALALVNFCATWCEEGIVRLTTKRCNQELFMRQPARMRSDSLDHRHRFPAEIISHCVWLYFRFAVSFRDVEEMLAMRGVSLSYETIREWCLKFGQTYANGLRRKSPRPGDRWHLNEVFLKINGRLHYLWRAVDQDGDVLDILVQSKRDKEAAKKFFRKLLKGLRYVPRTIITDKLRSYSAAKAEMLPSVEHCQGKWHNTRAENSHQPTRLRERVMRRFKSAGHAQRFLAAFGIITSHFRVGRHQYRARGYRQVMKSRFVVWQEVVRVDAIVN